MKWYLAATLSMTLVSLVGLGIIVFRFDPDQATNFIKVLFFLSLFLALWGLGSLMFSLLGILLRRGFQGIIKHYWKIRAADFSVFFRRGFLLSVGIFAYIFLRWWKGPDSLFPGIVILILVMVEIWSLHHSRLKDSVEDFS
ncbi:MAG: hypothetical protein Q8P35_02150 [Candidatus Yanofskybacteria bacterium]|nr:hypothetical protein [Candidatus Yanofskybacteria bacterium]